MRVVVIKGGGWSYATLPVEKGMVIELRGFLNDRKLLTHSYVEELEEGTRVRHCDGCGQDFVEELYQAHRARARHDLAGPVVVDGPQLKRPVSPPKVDLDPDKDSEWPLEPEGSPTVPTVEEEHPGGTRVRMGGS